MLAVVKEIALSNIGQAIIILLATTLLSRFLTQKGKLSWSLLFDYMYVMPKIGEDGVFPVRTRHFWFKNLGREPVDDIEITLNYKPQHLEVSPPRAYDLVPLPDGRIALRVPYLRGREGFTLSLLETLREIPNIANVRSKSAVTNLPMEPRRILSRHMQWASYIAMLAGVSLFAWIALQLVLVVLRIYFQEFQ